MYLAHAMAELAYVLCEAGRPSLGVDLVRDAQRLHGQAGSPRLRAWLYAAEAELCAHAGMPDDCWRALDAATAAFPPGSDDRDPDTLSILLNGAHVADGAATSLLCQVIARPTSVAGMRHTASGREHRAQQKRKKPSQSSFSLRVDVS